MMLEKKPIIEVAEIIMGQSPTGDTYNHIGDGLPLLNGPTEFGYYNPECTMFTTDSKRESKQGDLIFCVRGSTTGRMNWAEQIYSLGRGVCAIRGESKLKTKYIKYCLDAYLDGLLQLAGGGTFPNLTRNDIGGFKIPYSDMVEKIASILSAYDDLIENNMNRIKLLEEKAQLHYKELIQELSYNKTKSEEYIKDCLAFYIGGGWGEEDYKEGFTEPAFVIRGTDIPDAKKGEVKGVPFRYHKESNLESRSIMAGDIVFEVSGGSKGQPVGRSILVTEKMLHQFGKPVMCASFCKMLRLKDSVTPEFFYLYLLASHENGVIAQYEKHSASNIVNYGFEEFIREQKIAIPKETDLKAFTEKVKPIFTLISIFGEQNSKLREARDILLPRLINGQIEV
jgi:type I restriction enzyme S subunit